MQVQGKGRAHRPPRFIVAFALAAALNMEYSSGRNACRGSGWRAHTRSRLAPCNEQTGKAATSGDGNRSCSGSDFCGDREEKPGSHVYMRWPEWPGNYDKPLMQALEHRPHVNFSRP